MKRSFQFRQGGQSLAKYYNEINSIFIELNYLIPNDMSCAIDIEKLKKCNIEDQIYIFLIDLDQSLDQTSSQFFATSPLTCLEEASLLVYHEV